MKLNRIAKDGREKRSVCRLRMGGRGSSISIPPRPFQSVAESWSESRCKAISR